MRCVDFMLALPGLLVAIVVVSVVGGGYAMAILLLAIFNVQGDIRIVRGSTLEQKPLPYIEALRSLGIGRRRIMFRHILPNVAPILVANFAIDFALALVALAGLSFLGLGSEPGSAEWGAMLAENQSILFVNPAAVVGTRHRDRVPRRQRQPRRRLVVRPLRRTGTGGAIVMRAEETVASVQPTADHPAVERGDALLDVGNLVVSAGGAGASRTILSSVDLFVRRGETVGLVGESAAASRCWPRPWWACSRPAWSRPPVASPSTAPS